MAFDHARFFTELDTEYLARSEFLALESTTSTNDVARGELGNAGFVVIADAQTHGRGTHGRLWESPPGEDIYCSLVLHFPPDFRNLHWLSLAVGLALSDVAGDILRDTTDAPRPTAQVKWPNDLWLTRSSGDSRKCAGILVESHSSSVDGARAVIGFGVNVNRQVFAAGLNGRATSFRLEAAKIPPDWQAGIAGMISRERVLAEVLRAIETRVAMLHDSMSAESLLRDLNARLLWRDRPVTVDSQHGYVRGVLNSGALSLETERGLEELFVGHVELADPNES